MFKRFLKNAWSQLIYPLIWGFIANWMITLPLTFIIVILIAIF